jgi:MFS family permease
MPSGRLSDKIGRKNPFSLAYVITFVVFIFFAYAPSFTSLAILMAVYGVGWGMRVAPAAAMLSESVSSKDKPLALAFFMTMFDIGVGIGALLAGIMASYFSVPFLLFLSAPMIIIAILIFYLLSTEIPR